MPFLLILSYRNQVGTFFASDGFGTSIVSIMSAAVVAKSHRNKQTHSSWFGCLASESCVLNNSTMLYSSSCTFFTLQCQCYEFLSFFVSLNVSPHYAVLSFVGLIHALSIVSSYGLLFVLHVVLLLFHILF